MEVAKAGEVGAAEVHDQHQPQAVRDLGDQPGLPGRHEQPGEQAAEVEPAPVLGAGGVDDSDGGAAGGGIEQCDRVAEDVVAPLPGLGQLAEVLAVAVARVLGVDGDDQVGDGRHCYLRAQLGRGSSRSGAGPPMVRRAQASTAIASAAGRRCRASVGLKSPTNGARTAPWICASLKPVATRATTAPTRR